MDDYGHHNRGGAGAPITMTVPSKDGTQIASRRSSTGPALVLVHGATADHTAWDGVRPELERSFTVYAMERRGRGLSGDAQPYVAEREFEDVAALVDGIGGPVDVVGHSWGAVCALEAARRTQNIARLVLYDPVVISTRSPEDPFDLPDELDALIAQDRRDEALGLFYQRAMGESQAMIRQLRADPGWSSRVASAHTIPREMRAVEANYRFAWNQAREIDQPTLLLLGELSPPLMHASAAALHAVLHSSRLVVLHGHGHGGLRTAPSLVAAEVLRFLRSDAN
jgi:pimeloyl-ACP methyl ester carboxylesterase